MSDPRAGDMSRERPDDGRARNAETSSEPSSNIPSGNEIPGFIWDPLSRRYLKIMPNHYAKVMTGRAAEASHENAQEIKNSKKRSRPDRQTSSRGRLQVRKPRLRQRHVFEALSVEQRILDRRNAMDCYTKAWTSMVKNIESFSPLHSTQAWQITQKTVDNSALIGIKYDKNSTAENAYSMQHHHIRYLAGERRNCVSDHTLLFSKPTSLSVTEQHAFITTYSRNSPNYVLGMPENVAAAINAGNPVVCNFMPIRKMHSDHDYWCTALHPGWSSPKMAVGTETGVMVESPCYPQLLRRWEWLGTKPQLHGSQPTTSIQWLSQDVIIAGRRDGLIKLYDIRAKDAVFRLRHDKFACRIKCADESRVLIGGPEKLCMYDLRYAKRMHKKRYSRPWLEYKAYDNRRILSADVDISTRLGLLAVAQQSSTELWNLWTGEFISELCAPKPRSALGRDPIGPHKIVSTMLQFTRENDKKYCFHESTEPVGLLLGNEDSIIEWALHDIYEPNHPRDTSKRHDIDDKSIRQR